MKKISKILFVMLALCLAFCFAACGTYTPPSGGGGSTVNPDPGGDNPPATGDAFTVTLLLSGDNFTSAIYPNVDLIQAQWTNLDTGEKHRAYFDEDGIASITGLDGDYQVTLDKLPDGYTYNPNIYRATNTAKEVAIMLYAITPTSGTGADPFHQIITIATTGAYRVTLQSPDQEIWFKVRPSGNGIYSIESLVDVTANKINPTLYRYYGSDAYVNPDPAEIIDGGGYESSFTKNFRWEFTLSTGEVGAPFLFVIRTTNNDPTAYPINIDFIYDRDGDFTGGMEPAVTVNPTHDFSTWNWQSTPNGTFTYSAYRDGIEHNLLDQTMVKLNPEDGFYYYYDEVTGEYGDMLFAKITEPTEIVDLPFTDTTYMNIRYLNGKNYFNFIHQGYALHVNLDGCYPVTEELRQFLQDYATSQALFDDGNGLAELGGYNSDEDSMWMYACGFYKQ